MRKIKKTLCVILSVMLVFTSMAIASSAAEIGDTGSFSILNYNVAGLPIPSSLAEDGKDAFADSFLIGAAINALDYDIVAVQEDFNYDVYLRDQLTIYDNVLSSSSVITERHQTDHSGGVPLGDGLNIFSKYALYNDNRVAWEETSGITTDGSDELIPKGLLVVTIELEEGYYLDLYDIHIDAYSGEGSVAARRAEFTQLAEYIMKHSVYDETTGTYDHAVIVTGDFNASIYLEDEEYGDCLVENLLEAAHLNDAWAVQTIDAIEEDPSDYSAYYEYAEVTSLTEDQAWGHYDSVERFCYADGNGIDLSLDDFYYFEICDDTGRSLSDHYAASATFSYEIIEKVQDTSSSHDSADTTQNVGFLFKFLNYIASLFKAIGLLLQDYMNWFN
ncbi:MAG: hypothetical protein LUG85_07740 [Clostridiales bacterium]|nr:hypothetical protein [Clostridiales bacterium]MCD7828407.1 hypothetical protein [Clostridiales bacterium]